MDGHAFLSSVLARLLSFSGDAITDAPEIGLLRLDLGPETLDQFRAWTLLVADARASSYLIVSANFCGFNCAAVVNA